MIFGKEKLKAKYIYIFFFPLFCLMFSSYLAYHFLVYFTGLTVLVSSFDVWMFVFFLLLSKYPIFWRLWNVITKMGTVLKVGISPWHCPALFPMPLVALSAGYHVMSIRKDVNVARILGLKSFSNTHTRREGTRNLLCSSSSVQKDTQNSAWPLLLSFLLLFKIAT